MSGGSFNYLYKQNPPDVGDLLKMWWWLKQNHYHVAAADTLTIAEYLHRNRAPTTRQTHIHENLKPVWKAVEWHRSGDWSKEDADAAIFTYLRNKIVDNDLYGHDLYQIDDKDQAMTDKQPTPAWFIHAALALILATCTSAVVLALYALWHWITR